MFVCSLEFAYSIKKLIELNSLASIAGKSIHLTWAYLRQKKNDFVCFGQGVLNRIGINGTLQFWQIYPELARIFDVPNENTTHQAISAKVRAGSGRGEFFSLFACTQNTMVTSEPPR